MKKDEKVVRQELVRLGKQINKWALDESLMPATELAQKTYNLIGRFQQHYQHLYDNEIILDASDSDPLRIARLNRIIGYASALGNDTSPMILSYIDKLFDNKGMLEVTWVIPPTDAEKAIFAKAWDSEIGDGSPNVTHFVFGEE